MAGVADVADGRDGGEWQACRGERQRDATLPEVAERLDDVSKTFKEKGSFGSGCHQATSPMLLREFKLIWRTSV